MNSFATTHQSKLIAARRIVRLYDQILFKKQTIQMSFLSMVINDQALIMLEELRREIISLYQQIDSTIL